MGIAMITQAKKSSGTAAIGSVKKGAVDSTAGSGAAAATSSSSSGDNHDNNNDDMDYNNDDIVDSSSSNGTSAAAAAPAAPQETLRTVYNDVRILLQVNQVMQALRVFQYTTRYTIYITVLTTSLPTPLYVIVLPASHSGRT